MNKIKVIKTEKDYKEALIMVRELMDLNPDPNSENADKLHLLATLIEDYESNIFPESLPDPIDAILFRMEQANLKPTDLIPFIGSRSKVSEILSRKRPLTLSMIRALEAGLGIPSKVLLKEPDEFRNANNIVWGRFPLKQMEKRGYFKDKISKTSDIKMILERFLLPIGTPVSVFGMLRKTNFRSTRPMDKHALIAWSAAVVGKAKKIKNIGTYKAGSVDLAFMQNIARLSPEDNGPILAQEYLKKHGVALVIEPHFPQTYLDGAAILIDKKHPIIGLTLRYDRLDNFWFNLMHELSHISLHHDQSFNFFYDDLDNPSISDQKEKEADQMAGEALVPQNKWENSPAKLIPSPIAAESLARELGVHIAIIAGKMQKEGDEYYYLSNITAQAKVRKYFPDIHWNK